MKTIKVTIRDKIAVAEKDALYICGNSDFVIAFDFDDEWAGYEYKTARFVFNDTFADVVFSGNECAVPVLSNTYNFIVGVYAGDLCTTTPAYVAAKKSILCDSGTPAESFGDAYAQLIKVFNQTMEGVGSISTCMLNAEASAKSAKASEEAAAASAKGVSDKEQMWFDSKEVDVFTETSVSINEYIGQHLITTPFSLVPGKTYTVAWNGVEYNCKAWELDSTGDGSYTTVVLGHGGGGDPSMNTGEPFVICALPDGEEGGVYGTVSALDGSTDVTLRIHYVDVKLNEELLPDTVVQNGDPELILRSPSGKLFKITVDDNGTLSTKELTE